MKKAVMRASKIVRERHLNPEINDKPTGSDRPDFETNADMDAQDEFVRIMIDSCRTYGFIGEERDRTTGKPLRIPRTHPKHHLRFFADGLDGTRAFVRGQSTGIGTMLALGCDDEIIAAYVGDVMTEEVYCLRPGGNHVYRYTERWGYKKIVVDVSKPLRERYVLTQDHPLMYTPAVRDILGAHDLSTLRFTNIEAHGGSIGISMARLWKGEVGAMILHGGKQNPWDLAPVYGICKHLGFRFMKIEPELPIRVTPIDIVIQDEPWNIDGPMIVVHESYLPEIASW
jgi:fructose-1,6-bisphosphatase/inositol monophosphatase family enzyme